MMAASLGIETTQPFRGRGALGRAGPLVALAGAGSKDLAGSAWVVMARLREIWEMGKVWVDATARKEHSAAL